MMGGGIEELLRDRYEYIRLCYLFDKKLYALGDEYYLSFEKLAGTQGYIIKPSAAKKFISKAKFIYTPIDDYMDKFYKHKVLNIVKIPLLLKHNYKLESDISNLGRINKKLKVYRKIVREIFRFYPSIFKILYAFYIKKKFKLK